MRGQSNGNKHSQQQRGRQQIWLLPVCFLLAVLLALLLLKPRQSIDPESVKTSQEQPTEVAQKSAKDRQESPVSEATEPESLGDAPKKLIRFVKLSTAGKALNDNSPWACALDREQKLIWEVKLDDGGWQDRELTYSWYSVPPDKDEPRATTARHGLADGGHCIYINCDTAAYIEHMNSARVCARNNRRLPDKAELSNLDHPVRYYPDINTDFFPHTMPGYYWSSSESGKDKNLAFAVDFNNNVTYAIEKRLAYHIRAVADAGQEPDREKRP